MNTVVKAQAEWLRIARSMIMFALSLAIAMSTLPFSECRHAEATELVAEDVESHAPEDADREHEFDEGSAVSSHDRKKIPSVLYVLIELRVLKNETVVVTESNQTTYPDQTTRVPLPLILKDTAVLLV